jgi:peptidoglycan hydrolase CwlO-like protein
MEYAVSLVVVAIISGPLMWFLKRFDKRNTDQHDKNMEVLNRVETKVDRLDEKVDHLDSKVIHVDAKIYNVDTRVADIHDRVNSLEKPKPVRGKLKSV